MRVLLDPHTFLWWNTEDPQLSARAKEIIANGLNEVFVSAASAWEIAIKASKGKVKLPEHPMDYIEKRMGLYRFLPLPVEVHHATRVYDLPAHHADPFDRLLIAQSQLEELPLITVDSEIKKYEVEIIW